MGRKKEKLSFDEFYEHFFPGRWTDLKTALLEDPERTAYTEGLVKPYYLDEASILAAKALGVKEGDKVLDMCAAPGGKTLILALKMGKEGTLVSNDRSSARRSRLKKVILEHLPEEIRDNITVTGHDAARWALYEKNTYDRILLDAPCSSERHVLDSPSHMNKWSPARTKHLAVQAYAMLASALEAVKPGGTVVYSTCTVSPVENDGVLEKLLKKKKGRFEFIDPQIPVGEPSEYGWQILPDTAGGIGPMFIAKIKRLN